MVGEQWAGGTTVRGRNSKGRNIKGRNLNSKGWKEQWEGGRDKPKGKDWGMGRKGDKNI